MILGKITRGERLDHFETVRMHKSGRRIQVSLTISPVKDKTGRVIGAAKIARDITDRKNTEQALRRTEKLAATGQLAASIAHEINNPMQALANLLALIGYRTSLDESTRKLCALADSELQRMAHITRQMLSFYRETAVPVPLKLTEVMEDVLELFAQRLRSNSIKVERRYDLVPEVPAYPVEIRQLFANLIANAMEAVEDRGRIVIRMATGFDWRNSRRTGLRITIADNGSGIPEDVRSHIFEAFFTTKAERGTGLGLWVAAGIVAKHLGSIRMRTSTAKSHHGTIFSVFLPFETSGLDSNSASELSQRAG
jgi:two-component system CheB/CheR fusion protein